MQLWLHHMHHMIAMLCSVPQWLTLMWIVLLLSDFTKYRLWTSWLPNVNSWNLSLSQRTPSWCINVNVVANNEHSVLFRWAWHDCVTPVGVCNAWETNKGAEQARDAPLSSKTLRLWGFSWYGFSRDGQEKLRLRDGLKDGASYAPSETISEDGASRIASSRPLSKIKIKLLQF